MEPRGTAVLNRDNPQFERLAAPARRRGIRRILGFGEHAGAAVPPDRLPAGRRPSSEVTAEILGRRLDYRLAAPGRHWVQNSLGVLAAVAALGLDLGLAAGDARRRSARPRAAASAGSIALPGGTLRADRRELQRQPGRHARRLRRAGPRQAGPGGRRIAVLGDMLELGDDVAAPPCRTRRAARRRRRRSRVHLRAADERTCRRPCRARGAAAMPTIPTA